MPRGRKAKGKLPQEKPRNRSNRRSNRIIEPHSNLADDVLINLLCTEGDRLSREVIDEIVRGGDAVVDPLTWLVMDIPAWRGRPPTHWAPVHATFALGAIGGENALMGLITAAEHAEACACERGVTALPAMFARFGAG